MTTTSRMPFLVAVLSTDGTWQRASSDGYVLGGAGASHPLVAPLMNEDAHAAICRAAQWMFSETTRPNFLDLVAGGRTWRVSPMTERAV